MLDAEADGLDALRSAGFLRVPALVGQGIAGETAWLALEWMHCGRATPAAERALGEALARQHSAPGEYFGWHRDNAIGASPQPNGSCRDWAEFFAGQRLGYQLELAAARGLPASLLEPGHRLRARVPALLGERRAVPALLHGDLWGGNWAVDASGRPFVFDPAVHFGDAECDLAMTRLFGGFGRDFYAAYDAVLQPAPGRDRRTQLYQLYHVLNHANLFGGGYVGQAERMIGRLLAASG